MTKTKRIDREGRIAKCDSLLLVDILKDVLEPSVILLEDCVLGAHVERPALHQRILEAGMGKARDGLEKQIENGTG